MNKETLTGLVVVGTPFLCVGFMIGGYVANKINDKYHDLGVSIWKDTAEFFKDQLEKEWHKSDILRNKLESYEKEA